MKIPNPMNPRYTTKTGPSFEDIGTVRYWMDNQSYVTFMTADTTGNIMHNIEKHDSLEEARARLEEMEHARQEPSAPDVMAEAVLSKIMGEDDEE